MVRVLVPLLAPLPGAAVAAPAGEVEEALIGGVYGAGGQTLYCATPFEPGDRVEVDYIYSEKQLLRQFSCITSRQCASKAGFDQVAGDLHNLYPIERAVSLDRRGSQFGDLPEDVPVRECHYQMSFQTFDPPDHAKGNVARAMIYMHARHSLPLLGALQMYQNWNTLDPPDEAERARNAAIERLQGNRNPYIDRPDLANRLTGLPGR